MGNFKTKEEESLYNKSYYRERKDKLIPKNKEKAIARKTKSREFVNSFKRGKRCTDCHEFFPEICLDFDHRVPTEKFLGIGEMLVNGYALDKIQEEMRKCDIVCSCCHRLRTERRHGEANRLVTVTVLKTDERKPLEFDSLSLRIS